MQPPVAVLRYISKHSFTWVGNQFSNKSALLPMSFVFSSGGGEKGGRNGRQKSLTTLQEIPTQKLHPSFHTQDALQNSLCENGIFAPLASPPCTEGATIFYFFLHPLPLCFTFLLAVFRSSSLDSETGIFSFFKYLLS